MELGSETKEIAESYPQTAENYPKARDALKKRYGGEDLLVNFYVGELLKIVIKMQPVKRKFNYQP